MARSRSCIKQSLRGMLKQTVMQRRRETTYRMLAKRHAGLVPCYVCAEHVPLAFASLEHIVPLSRGGTDEMSNLAISHYRCNQLRGNALPIEVCA